MAVVFFNQHKLNLDKIKILQASRYKIMSVKDHGLELVMQTDYHSMEPIPDIISVQNGKNLYTTVECRWLICHLRAKNKSYMSFLFAAKRTEKHHRICRHHEDNRKKTRSKK